MLGAIGGDMVGSVHEFGGTRTTDFPLFTDRSAFTDDTVMTVAVAWSILRGEGYGESMRRFGRRYPHAGYGGMFRRWLLSADMGPYNSWGNGSAMRASPVGWAFGSVEEVLAEAARSASVTHDHPEGMAGAQAAALAVFLARTGAGKEAIRRDLAGRFGYDLSRSVDEIRPGYSFDVSCRGSVPESVIAFFDSTGYEDAVRKAVSLGGDADTMACIAGSVAEAYYGGVPGEIEREVLARLPEDLRAVVDEFRSRYC